jgi:hypothetical protein
MAGREGDNEESGSWTERMERSITDPQMQDIDKAIEQVIAEIGDPKISNEEFLQLLQEFDHEQALEGEYDISIIRRIPIPERVGFFRYFMLQMFCRMAEEEGTSEAVQGLERAGFYSLMVDDTNKPWKGLFGHVPRFEASLLGMLQACLRPKAAPNSDRSELERDPQLAQIYRQIMGASRGGGGSVKIGPVLMGDVLRCTGAAMWVFAQRSVTFAQVLMEDQAPELKGLGKDQRIDKVMPDMMMVMHFLMTSSGLYEKLIDGLVRNDPLLRRAAGSNAFEVTPSGRAVEWIKK